MYKIRARLNCNCYPNCYISCNSVKIVSAYADGMILHSNNPQLMDLLELNYSSFDIVCNTKKTICMMLKPQC